MRQRVIVNPTNTPEPKIIIEAIETGAETTTVTAHIENPTSQTDAGTLIAAVYDKDNVCRQVRIISGGTAEFDKITSGKARVFLWSGLSGEDAMKPLLDFADRIISN